MTLVIIFVWPILLIQKDLKTKHLLLLISQVLKYSFYCIYTTTIYKITKIVRPLWLAERSVCMRVCNHGCGVKMFCFSRTNHASTNLKKFSSSKLDKFTLFTRSFVGWNMENRYKEGESIFLRLSWHFKREKSVFWKASFWKTRTDYACETSWTRLCDWQEFCLFDQCHTKSFAFFSGKLFDKSNRKRFSRVCIVW